ncbi:MAG: ATP-grasp domain-containing protein [Fimbriimonadaceae bacterium]
MIRSACEIAGRDEDCILPGIDTLETIQDKLLQRQAYARYGAPTPKAVPINPDDPKSAMDAIGFPCVLKARFGGYDGKGTRTTMTPPEFVKYEDLWSQGGWLVEEFVPFRRELAVMVYRSKTETGVFPTMETIQTSHVCDLVFPVAPMLARSQFPLSKR